jgi:hypothetical protein
MTTHRLGDFRAGFCFHMLEQATGFEPVLKPWQSLVLAVKHYACIIWSQWPDSNRQDAVSRAPHIPRLPSPSLCTQRSKSQRAPVDQTVPGVGGHDRNRTCTVKDHDLLRIARLPDYATCPLSIYLRLVPPHGIGPCPRAFQTPIRTSYTKAALFCRSPGNRTPTKSFGDSYAATTPAIYFVWQDATESNGTLEDLEFSVCSPQASYCLVREARFTLATSLVPKRCSES